MTTPDLDDAIARKTAVNWIPEAFGERVTGTLAQIDKRTTEGVDGSGPFSYPSLVLWIEAAGDAEGHYVRYNATGKAIIGQLRDARPVAGTKITLCYQGEVKSKGGFTYKNTVLVTDNDVVTAWDWDEAGF